MRLRPRSHSKLGLDASLLSFSHRWDDSTLPYRPAFLARRATQPQYWPHCLPAAWRLWQNALEGSYLASVRPELAPSITRDKNSSRDCQSHPPSAPATYSSPGTWHSPDRVGPPGC